MVILRAYTFLLIASLAFLPSRSSAVESGVIFAAAESVPGSIAQTIGPKSTAGQSSKWGLARARGRKDDEQFVTIMRTADTLKSDPEFVGLMVRCGPQSRIDVLLVVVTPLPPQSRPRVTITSPKQSVSFVATTAAGGAAIALPVEASELVAGAWHAVPALSISIEENDIGIRGLVDLTGLPAAYRNLLGNCQG
jgi:hypothetical protein